jgi:glucose dehydrogenase
MMRIVVVLCIAATAGILHVSAQGPNSGPPADPPRPAPVSPPLKPVTLQDHVDGLKDSTRWLMYSGDYTGRRHSPLTQITPANAGRLAAQWAFQVDNMVAGRGFEGTPLQVDGVLYVTGQQQHGMGDRRPHRGAVVAVSPHSAWGPDLRSGECVEPRVRDPW